MAIAFEAVLPDLSHVPIDTVLEVRRRTSEERFAFQEALAALTARDAFDGADAEAVGREMSLIYERRIEPAMQAIERAARVRWVEAAKRFFSIKTALTGVGGIAAGAAVSGPSAPVVGSGLAVGFGMRGPRAWSLLRTIAEVRPPYTAGAPG